jgi:hypothetical protein
MKINRQINDCYCYNCRKYEQCKDEGAFAEAGISSTSAWTMRMRAIQMTITTKMIEP